MFDFFAPHYVGVELTEYIVDDGSSRWRTKVHEPDPRGGARMPMQRDTVYNELRKWQ